ncbi:hypothetical protein F2Q70_00027310 [Brassica cretica]|uniref:Phenolic glucoside malonyltransferase 1-like n=1 Tax=Brassica cretica TaxID=69181 RepID=A0A8S9LCR7_BRACR|nr:hypothetical protein F2Q70_00027310 [Brassica cretica]
MVSALNVIDVSRVTPSDSPEPFTLSLTFFDLLWYKLHPVQRVIFYRLADATRPFFDSVIVPNLKSSLSSSLSHYLPLAGKLVWDSLDKKPSLKYSQNDAVSFTVAESNAEFSLLTGNKPFPTTELYPLVPELQVSDESASAVSFQVTLFPNQGFCIGTSLRKKKPKELDAESIWCNSNDSGLLGRNEKEREAKANEPHG